MLQAGNCVLGIHAEHLFGNLERLLDGAFLLELRQQLAVLGQGIADQPLLVVKRSNGERDGGVAGSKSLDLLVDGYRLQEVGVLGVVLADILILSNRLFLTVIPDEKLGQSLTVPDLFRLHGYHLLIVLDCLVDLPLQHEALSALQYFVFFGSQLNASYHAEISNPKIKANRLRCQGRC